MRLRKFFLLSFLATSAAAIMRVKNNELYFTVTLTENEHYIVEGMIDGFCEQQNLRLHYYRKLKTGHVSLIRECKISGKNVFKFFDFADKEGLILQNYNRSSKAVVKPKVS